MRSGLCEPELLGTVEETAEGEEGRGLENTMPRINIIQSGSRGIITLMVLPVFRVRKSYSDCSALFSILFLATRGLFTGNHGIL